MNFFITLKHKTGKTNKLNFNLQTPIPFIHPTRKILGIFIGVFSSLSFYIFFYVIRESLRVISMSNNFELWILSDAQLNFYNLIFAYISLILGLSNCFQFWVDKPIKSQIWEIRKRTSIVNDQRVLNWFFLSWSSRFSMVIWGFFLSSQSFSLLCLYPKYNYLFILFIIVLYLQLWTTLSRIYRRRSIKWMLITGICLSLCALGLSKVNIVDYNKYLKQSIKYKYQLNLVELDYHPLVQSNDNYLKLHFVVPRSNNNPPDPILVRNNHEISLDEIKNISPTIPNPVLYNRKTLLYIDQSVKFQDVKTLINSLSELGIYKVGYVIKPLNTEEYTPFPVSIPGWLRDKEVFPDNSYLEAIEENELIINIEYNKNSILLNGNIIDTSEFKSKLKSLLLNNLNGVIKYHSNDTLSYAHYIRTYGAIVGTRYEIRNEYALSKKGNEYVYLDRNMRREIGEKFLFPIYEIHAID